MPSTPTYWPNIHPRISNSPTLAIYSIRSVFIPQEELGSDRAWRKLAISARRSGGSRTGRSLTGAGRFIDDLRLRDVLEAAFVRSPHAHAAIRRIDATAARRMPGVEAVLTLADLSPLISQERLPLQFRTAELPPDITPFVLAKEEVAFVGEAVAVAIARSRYLAEDAAAAVAVDYEPLPAVSDCRSALAPAAPPAHRGRAGNLLLQFRQAYGDVAGAFARASHCASVNLSSIAAAPIRSKVAVRSPPMMSTRTG